MRKVLTPLTTPPINPPPEESSAAPQSCASSRILREILTQSMARSDKKSCSWGRYTASSLTHSWARSKAAGIWLSTEDTASAMPGPMTVEARVSTAMTASSVSTRARGRRSLAPRRALG